MTTATVPPVTVTATTVAPVTVPAVPAVPAVTAAPARSRARLAVSSRLVELPAGATVEDLLLGCPRKLVFSTREQRRSGRRRDLTGWGGRLAAKLAACDVLDIPGDDAGVPAALLAGRDIGLAGLEVLPSRAGLCADPARCVLPHRPELTLSPTLSRHLRDGERLEVSISHTRTAAIALVVRFAATDRRDSGVRT